MYTHVYSWLDLRHVIDIQTNEPLALTYITRVGVGGAATVVLNYIMLQKCFLFESLYLPNTKRYRLPIFNTSYYTISLRKIHFGDLHMLHASTSIATSDTQPGSSLP